MRTSAILIVGCFVVLGGAFFASRALVSEVPVPVPVPAPTQVGVQSVVAPLPEGTSPEAPAQAPQPDTAAHRPMLVPHQVLQPVTPPPSGYPRLVEANNPPPPPASDIATSPFKGESKELDYAELMLTDPTPDPTKLRSAYEVMARCTEQEPDNQRCLDGLALAKRLLSAPTTTERKPPVPTLQKDPSQVNRPVLHPK
jgi:hypothetical protein